MLRPVIEHSCSERDCHVARRAPRGMDEARALRLAQAVLQFKPKETAVLILLCKGETNKRISAILQIPIRTVENCRRRVSKALEAKSTAELVKYAVRLEDAGWIHLGI